MAVRRFAALCGVVFVLLGLLGFTTSHLFGLFHTHPLHNVIHLAVGLLGLIAAFAEGYAYLYAKAIGVLYLLLAVLGVFTPELFGLMTVGPADDVLHFLTGAIALYFGFVLSDEATATVSARTRRTR